ncbi:MAG TPA: SDR family NAD(P)-dependent oxidoreductase [Solirubrobacteraceae bacterium]|nr:SDR family NAD(P)-dependent oxidoreductase [Solirubrobacteraceae bacterium]
MSDWLGLRGARVLVAGAGTLGAALVQGFADVGAEVAVIDVSRERLDEIGATASIAAERLIAADLSAADGARAAMSEAQAALGGLDVFVHGVGINDRRPIEDYSPEDWDRFIAVNLSSVFFTAQVALEAMRAQQHGRVVFFSSVAGLMGHRRHGPYAATKGAINQLTKVMAHEYAADGVTVNAVAPGYMETNLTQAYLDAHPEERERLLTLIPAGRFGRLPEVVGPVLFLASEQASFITGHIMYIDGGRTVV